jgi:hypothetical protein
MLGLRRIARFRSSRHLGLLALISVLFLPTLTANAAPPANEHFLQTWERTERPVVDGVTSRTWMWGPEARTGPMSEPYVEAIDGYRLVQYFDKTRMEINNPDADPESVWYVTNGLLAKELITGRVQVGHIQHIQVAPAEIHIAGDLHPDTPTYQTLSHLLDAPPRDIGEVIVERLERDGPGYLLQNDPELEHYTVRAAYFVPETERTIAEPFWEFMNSTGLIRQDGFNVRGELFEDPFFATGMPITEAYWVHVPVDGAWQDVLLQCFERRCLTYTPGNPDGWQVEAGNIGLHYHRFRYGRPPKVLDCVDVNVATYDDLLRIRNVGEARARDILAMRPFATLEDLESVSGIGPVTVQQIIDQGLACVEYEPYGEKDFHQLR